MKMSQRLLRNASTSVAQAIISGVMLFFLYRYLIDKLGVIQLGLWSVVLASTSVARFSDMGLTGSVVKFVAQYRALNDDAGAAAVTQTAALSIAGVMAILCLSIYPLLDNLLLLAIPLTSMKQALEILPWAMSSLWLGSVAGVFLSGLDGCQRMDIRNVILVLGNIIYFVAALFLVPRFGLLGLAVGQAIQGALLILASWIFLRRQLKQLPWLPLHWNRLKFIEMFGYAVNFQINSIAILMFDPVIKLLMSRYGELASVGYFEMANQFVLKLRALLIAANQALVPFVAELHETEPSKVRDLYLTSYQYVYFLSLPFYAGMMISLPLVSYLWLGYIEDQFVFFGSILAIGWGLNTLTAPAYFVNLGTGDLRWNTYALIAIAILNVFLGLSLGSAYDSYGVAIGAMTSLVAGSAIVIAAMHLRFKFTSSALVPKSHYVLTLSVLVCICISIWTSTVYPNTKHELLINIFVVVTCFFIMLLVSCLHSDGRALLLRIRNMRTKLTH